MIEVPQLDVVPLPYVSDVGAYTACEYDQPVVPSAAAGRSQVLSVHVAVDGLQPAVAVWQTDVLVPEKVKHVSQS